MDKLIWEPIYETGFKIIDDHHKFIFGRINLVMQAVINSLSDDKIRNYVEELEDFFSYHVRLEDDLCKCYGYPGLDEIQEEHCKIADLLSRFKKSIGHSENLLIELEGVYNFFRFEVTKHITDYDKKYVRHVFKKIINEDAIDYV